MKAVQYRRRPTDLESKTARLRQAGRNLSSPVAQQLSRKNEPKSEHEGHEVQLQGHKETLRDLSIFAFVTFVFALGF